MKKVMYAFSAVMAVLFIYMFISEISYITGYMAAYEMPFSEMGFEAVKYVIDGSVNYLVYALLLFCAGKVLETVLESPEKDPEDRKSDVCEEPVKADRVQPEGKSAFEQRKQRKKRRSI